MPLHDTKCSECGHIDEVFFQPANKPKSFNCSKCKSVSKIMLGTPRINMGGSRPEEARLERAASDGLF